MRNLILSAALLCLGACVSVAVTHGDGRTSVTPSPETELIALERASWVAWQNHDAAFWQHFLSDDHVEVHSSGRATKTQIVHFVGSGACAVASYEVSDFQFTQFSADSAVLTYRAAQTTTCGSAPAPSPVWVTSGYTRRNGRWENTLFVETPLPAAHT